MQDEGGGGGDGGGGGGGEQEGFEGDRGHPFAALHAHQQEQNSALLKRKEMAALRLQAKALAQDMLQRIAKDESLVADVRKAYSVAQVKMCMWNIIYAYSHTHTHSHSHTRTLTPYTQITSC